MAEELVPYDPPQPFESASQPFSLPKYIAALKRKWWLLLLTTLIPLGASIYFVRVQPVVYVSRATAWVRGKLRLADVGQYTEDVQTFFGTQIELLRSERMMIRAMERVKASPAALDPPKDSLGRPDLPRIRVVQAPKSSVITLEASSENSNYVRAFLDALIDEFMSYRKEIRTSTSGDALNSVSAQIYKVEADLKSEQEKLAAFSRTNNVALLEESLRGGGSQLAQQNAQIAFLKLETELLNATAIEKQAGVGPSTNGVVVHTNAAIAAVSSVLGSQSGNSPDFLSAQQQLEVLKIRRQQLGKFLRPKHPKMVRLSDEIAQAEQVIAVYQSRNAEQIRVQQAANQIRLTKLQESADELARKVAEANRRMAEYEQIRAGIARQQVYYERLLALLQGVDLNSSMNQEDVAILERATEGRPPKSQAPLIIGGAAFMGLFLGLGVVFLLVRADDRCDSVLEIKSQFPEPLFGQVPEVEITGPDGQIPVLTPEDTRHILVESCRGLRSSLLFGTHGKDRPRLITVTSAAPDEGKSTISLNLASALAQGGARVLLIDADIRRGHLHKILGIAVEPGLTECVEQGGELSKFVVPTKTKGLFFVPRGRVSISGELFLSASFDKLLESCRREFDYTILDSIPVFAADDATTLAPKSDGVLFVMRRSHTRAKLAQEALDLLYQRRSKVLGIVFNRADTSSRNYNYYKYSKYYSENATV